ncbi:MAG: thiamine biosynthesis protein ApbE [Nitrospira bacterium SG8_3]|nr:MAG: thiamine biosynthesis protein ApbE [Nitrospira bacterium SG8_3]
MEYRERTYRRRARAKDLVSFHVAVKETDLWVSAERSLEDETRDLILDHRHHLERYIQSHPDFLTTLQPYPEDPYAPSLVKEMIKATRGVGVGPMASVAGAIAQYVAKGLQQWSDQVIVENGGDIFLKANRPVTVSIFAGESPLSGKIGVVIPKENMPLGICSSSATVGHSLSMGMADLVCLLSPSAALADGAATALGNRIKSKSALEKVATWAEQMKGIMGGLVIVKDKMATWGEIELVGL